MSKIKGRYVATIIFDFDYDESDETEKGIRPFSDIQSDMKSGKVKEEIERNLLDWVFDSSIGTLKIEQQYADLYKPAEDERGRV